jgi:hypothetical protein
MAIESAVWRDETRIGGAGREHPTFDIAKRSIDLLFVVKH